MKKIIAFIVSVIITGNCLIPGIVSAEEIKPEEFNFQNKFYDEASVYEYVLNSYGEARINSYMGTEKNVVIPAEIDGHKVTEIGAISFLYSDIVSVKIPEGVKRIGAEAFMLCSELETVELPEGLEFIGDEAFEICEKLSSVNLPDSVTEIGGLAFERCGSLKSINIPAGIREIKWGAFAGCGFEKVVLPENLKVIPYRAFEYCDDMTELIIPDGIETIGREAFYGCDKLTEITVPESVTSIGDNALYTRDFLSDKNIPLPHLKIRGVKGTYAEMYAATNGIPFVADENSQDSESDFSDFDINGDGIVSINDYVYIQKLILGTADTESVNSADINGDGNVNILDLIRIKCRLMR